MIQRCHEDFPASMMYRLLKVSTSGYYEWHSRPPDARSQDNARFLRRIRRLYEESDCVFGGPRIWKDLRYDGETCSLNRVARLMKPNTLIGIPAKKQWCKPRTGEGWLYLAMVVDLCHGRVVGWDMSHRMEAQLVVTLLSHQFSINYLNLTSFFRIDFENCCKPHTWKRGRHLNGRRHALAATIVADHVTPIILKNHSGNQSKKVNC